jgi:hypothetical protein
VRKQPEQMELVARLGGQEPLLWVAQPSQPARPV